MKKILLTFIALGIVACGGYYAWWSQQPEQTVDVNDPDAVRAYVEQRRGMTGYEAVARYPQLRNMTYRITINGQDLHIPIGYFSSGRPAKREQQDMGISARLPDLEPYDELSTENSYRASFDKRMTYRVLISDPNKKIDLNDTYENRKRFTGSTEYVGKMYELSFFTKPKDSEYDRDDVYAYINKANEAVDVITCSSEKRNSRNPQCSHMFTLDKLYLKISYPKRYLPEWKDIKNKTINLIEEFKQPRLMPSEGDF